MRIYLCIVKEKIKIEIAMTRIKRAYLLPIIGIVIGMAGGIAYWAFVGCANGSCPIASSPVWSAIYGAAIGGLLLSAFRKDAKQ